MTTSIVTTAQQLVAALKGAHGGDKILLAPGSYGHFSLNGVNIPGGVTIASLDSSRPATLTGFHLTGSGGLTFSDLVLAGSGLTPFLVKMSHDLTFDNLNVHGNLGTTVQSQTAYGLAIYASSHITVNASRFHQLSMGVYFGGSSDHVSIIDSSFENIRQHGVHAGVATNVDIRFNFFSNIFPAAGDHPDAIIFHTAANSTSASGNILISDNVIERGAGKSAQGIFLRDIGGARPFYDVVIKDNLLVGEGYNGIAVDGAVGAQISGNTLYGYRGLKDWVRVLNSVGTSVVDNGASTYVYQSPVEQAGNSITQVVTDGGTAEVAAWTARLHAEKAANPNLFASLDEGAGVMAETAAASGGVAAPLVISAPVAGPASMVKMDGLDTFLSPTVVTGGNRAAADAAAPLVAPSFVPRKPVSPPSFVSLPIPAAGYVMSSAAPANAFVSTMASLGGRQGAAVVATAAEAPAAAQPLSMVVHGHGYADAFR